LMIAPNLKLSAIMHFYFYPWEYRDRLSHAWMSCDRMSQIRNIEIVNVIAAGMMIPVRAVSDIIIST